MKMPLSLLFATLLSVTAFGRIGETEEECKKRYGEPMAEQDRSPAFGTFMGTEKTLAFRKAGFRITIGFSGGKAEIVEYKQTNPALGKIEIEKLLEVNSGGLAWIKESAEVKNWTRADGKVFASVNDVTGVFRFTAIELKKRLEERRLAEQEKWEAELRTRLEGL